MSFWRRVKPQPRWLSTRRLLFLSSYGDARQFDQPLLRPWLRPLEPTIANLVTNRISTAFTTGVSAIACSKLVDEYCLPSLFSRPRQRRCQEHHAACR